MKFGLAMLIEDDIDTTLRTVQSAESAGFDYVWFADHFFLRDSVVLQTLACQLTKKVKIGTAVTSPYLRHPLALATTTASLNELSNGRVVLGLGPGGFEFKSQMLLDMKLPLTAVKESIEIIRGILRGETVTYQGKVFRVNKARLAYRVSGGTVPIYIAARGPNMVRLGGEVSDGIITHGTTEKFVRYSSEKVAEAARGSGRDREEVDIVVYAPTCLSMDRASAVGALAQYNVYMAGGEYSDEFLGLYGLSLEQVAPLREAIRSQDPGARDLVTPEMVDSFCLVGSAGDVVSKVERIEKAGMTQLAISAPSSLAEKGVIESVTGHIQQFGKEVISAFR